MNESTKEIIEFIASFLIDITGNEIFEKWKVKRKISKILKKDNENIKIYFHADANTDLYKYIVEFIMLHAFKEVDFYSSMELTTEQEEKLWVAFSNFIKLQTGNGYVNSNYKDKIIRCINLHNESLNNIIMDEQNLFHIKIMQNENKHINNSLKQIINTLNTETNLQDRDNELNFSVEQLEMIIKSYRFDINQLRKIQIMTIFGAILILLLMAVFIPLSLKSIDGFNPVIIMFSFLLMVVFLLLMFWKDTSIKLQKLEKELEKTRCLLWEIHYRLYKNQIETKYMKNKNSNS